MEASCCSCVRMRRVVSTKFKPHLKISNTDRHRDRHHQHQYHHHLDQPEVRPTFGYPGATCSLCCKGGVNILACRQSPRAPSPKSADTAQLHQRALAPFELHRSCRGLGPTFPGALYALMTFRSEMVSLPFSELSKVVRRQ